MFKYLKLTILLTFFITANLKPMAPCNSNSSFNINTQFFPIQNSNKDNYDCKEKINCDYETKEELGNQLIEATKNKNQLSIYKILEKGANIDFQDKNGETPLIHAARLGFCEIIQALINLSADLNKQNNEGRTALAIAIIHNKFEAAKILSYNGAKNNIEDKEGNSPISISPNFFNQDTNKENYNNNENKINKNSSASSSSHSDYDKKTKKENKLKNPTPNSSSKVRYTPKPKCPHTNCDRFFESSFAFSNHINTVHNSNTILTSKEIKQLFKDYKMRKLSH